MSQELLSVVVLSWNTRDLLRACLEALYADAPCLAREVIVVDNGSEDGSAEMVAAEFPGARLIRNSQNRLYAEANNQGARVARGRFLCLLNSDTEVRRGALDRMLGFLQDHPGHAAVSPKLVNPDGTLQRACRRLPTLLDPLLDSTLVGRFPPGTWLTWWSRMGDFDHQHSRDVPQPPGACFVMRTAEYLAMGGLEPQLSLFFNDVHLCRSLSRRGRRIRYLAEAEVMHHSGSSTRAHAPHQRNLLWTRNRAAYFHMNHGRFAERWLRGILWLWALETSLRIRCGPRAPSEKRMALAELRGFVRECAPA